MEAGKDFIRIQDDQIVIGYSVSKKVVGAGAYVDIPAFNLHYHSREGAAAEHEAKFSIRSFIHFWKNIQPKGTFEKHLTQLGFERLDLGYIYNPYSKPNSGISVAEGFTEYGTEHYFMTVTIVGQ